MTSFVRTRHRCSVYESPDLPKDSTYLLSPGLPTPGTPNLLRLPIAFTKGAGILTRFPSTTHVCLALGTDSPCADERCARKPWAFGGGAFHPPYRYSCQHSHFRYLQQTFRSTFAGLRNAPLPPEDSGQQTADRNEFSFCILNITVILFPFATPFAMKSRQHTGNITIFIRPYLGLNSLDIT